MKLTRKNYCKVCPIIKMWGQCTEQRKKLCKATWRTLTKSEKRYLLNEIENNKKKEVTKKEYKKNIEECFGGGM